MKQIFAAGALALCLAACAGAPRKSAAPSGPRPDWTDGASAAWPRDRYLTGSASAEDPETARDRARAELAKFFSTRISASNFSTASEFTSSSGDRTISQSSQDASQAVKATAERELEGVEIAAAWRDPADGRHYALAVLDRRKAQAALRSRLAETDAEAEAALQALGSAAKPLDKARHALRLNVLLKRREPLAADLRAAGGADSGYDAAGARQKAAAALAALSVKISVSPRGLAKVEAELAKAFSALGMQASASAAAPHLAADCETSFEAVADPDPASRWKWQRAAASVTLKDTAGDAAIAAFNASVREAAATEGEARQKAEAALGRRVAADLAKALNSYLENK